MSYSGHPDQHFGCLTYSQHGEDLMLCNLFVMLNISNQTLAWIDVGAHHPSNISNTKLLYERGYHGVNVEANPNLIALFNLERPRDTNINLGIGVETGTQIFNMYDQTSGRNTFSNEETKRLEGVMQVRDHMSLPVVRLNDIVQFNCNGTFPPLLSIDIEGLDYVVLENADFSTSRPMLIVVETRRDDTKRMAEMLYKKGYTLYCRMGENLIFVISSHYMKVF